MGKSKFVSAGRGKEREIEYDDFREGDLPQAYSPCVPPTSVDDG